MTSISRSALVMHSAQQMFDLVNDVQAYPDFLPGCSAVSILSQSDTELKASLTLSKVGVEYSITTCNTLVRPESMVMTLIDGPFETFEGIWEFTSLSEDACKVSLNMDFEGGSRLTGFTIGKLFKQVATSMVDVFVIRADEIYD
jgi:ribosome-associated toxin RatA of RatAB toxin-antitoxin module